MYIMQYSSSSSPTQLDTHLAQVRLKTQEPEPCHRIRDYRHLSQEDGWVHRHSSGEQGALSYPCNRDLHLHQTMKTLAWLNCVSRGASFAGAYRKWSASRVGGHQLILNTQQRAVVCPPKAHAAQLPTPPLLLPGQS